MLTAAARPDPEAPFSRAEIIVHGLDTPPARPAFQLRRSNVDYVEPNLDLSGWTRSEATLLPLDAWWVADDSSFHLSISGLLCQHIDPGPLKLRLVGAGGREADLFWPEEIAVYDDGTLASHTRLQSDAIRVVGSPVTPKPTPEPVPDMVKAGPKTATPPAEATPLPSASGAASTASLVPPMVTAPTVAAPSAPMPPPGDQRQRWRIALFVVLGAGIALAAAFYHTVVHRSDNVAAARTSPPRTSDQARRFDRSPAAEVTMAAALQEVIDDPSMSDTVAKIDPTLFVQPAGTIINRVIDPTLLLRYGAEKVARRDPAGADRLFEEATRPRFGPGHNRPYPMAYVARAVLYDPSVQRDLQIPVPNPEFADDLYRRALSSGDSAAVAEARRQWQRLNTWRSQH